MYPLWFVVQIIVWLLSVGPSLVLDLKVRFVKFERCQFRDFLIFVDLRQNVNWQIVLVQTWVAKPYLLVLAAAWLRACWNAGVLYTWDFGSCLFWLLVDVWVRNQHLFRRFGCSGKMSPFWRCRPHPATLIYNLSQLQVHFRMSEDFFLDRLLLRPSERFIYPFPLFSVLKVLDIVILALQKHIAALVLSSRLSRNQVLGALYLHPARRQHSCRYYRVFILLWSRSIW